MNKEEILSYCLDEIIEGKSTVDDCIRKYPYLKDELLPLIEIGLQIDPPEVAPSANFKRDLRNRLLAEDLPEKKTLHWLSPVAILRRARLSLVAMGLVPLFALGGTTVYAYERSLPDETLYPLKRAVENVQLSLATNSESKANLHLKLAERRSDEIVAQASLGRTVSAATVESAAGQLDKAITQISNVREEEVKPLLEKMSKSTLKQQAKLTEALEKAHSSDKAAVQQAISTTARGNLIAEMTSGNTSLLVKAPPSVRDTKLEESHFRIEGTLVSSSSSSWTIDGVTLPNVNIPRGAAATPDRGVKIEGVFRNGQVFISKIEVKGKEGTEFKLRGVFNGSSPDGTTWYVGGIAIPRPDDMPVPATGKQVTIQRSARARPADAGRGKDETRERRTEADNRTPAPPPSPTAAPTPPPSPRPTPSPSPTAPPAIRTITPSPAPKPPPSGGTTRPEAGKDGKRNDDNKDEKRGENRGSSKPTGVAPSPVPTPGQTREPTRAPERDDDKDGKKADDAGKGGSSKGSAGKSRNGDGSSKNDRPGYRKD